MISKNINRIGLSVLLLSIFVFIGGCNKSGPQTNNVVEKEATMLSDSLEDNSEELRRLVIRYHDMGEKKAELIVRQKYGRALRNISIFDEALSQHDTCIVMAQELKDTIQLIIAYNNQGTNYRRLGLMNMATDCHYQALELCEKIDDTKDLSVRRITTRTLNGLGNVLLTLKNYDAAEEFFRKSLSNEDMANNPTGIAINLANIGSVKEHQGDLDSAYIYYNRSLEYNRASNNHIGISLCYMYLGKLFELQGNNDEALRHYHKSYEISYPTGDSWHWLEPCMAIINLYINEHQNDSAKKYLDMGLEMAIDINSKDHLARMYGLCARFDEQNGNAEKALKEYHLSKLYSDSIAFGDSQNYIQNRRVNYESNKAKIAEEQAHNEKRIRYIILNGSVAIFSLGVIAFSFMFRWMRERRKATEALKKMDQERQDFYRGVTHQLRTPLTVVIGMTQQLRNFLPLDNVVAQKEFDAVERQTKNLLTLVTEMIEYSKNGNIDHNIITEYSKTQVMTDTNTTLMHGVEHRYGVPVTHENDNGNYVILAEDDPDVALLITEMLKSEGYVYAWAKDGQEALEMIREKMPDCLITDIMMPRMNGLELMKHVREDDSVNHLPIIVVSARVENEDRLVGIDAGAEVYLGKPFIPGELLLRIRKLLEQRRILRDRFKASITANTVATRSAGDVVRDTEETAESNVSTRNDAASNDNTQMIKETDELRMSNKERLFIDKINKTIQQNISDSDFSSSMLADLLNTTTGTLNRKLKNLTDIDTTHYIRMHRIAKAKELLLDSEVSMVDIQIACGFETPSYFSRVFKADVGVSPSEYRKNNCVE